MKLATKIIIGICIFLSFAVLSYLATTGILWVVLWCLSELNVYNFNSNIWAFGLVVWIAIVFINLSFNAYGKKE